MCEWAKQQIFNFFSFWQLQYDQSRCLLPLLLAKCLDFTPNSGDARERHSYPSVQVTPVDFMHFDWFCQVSELQVDRWWLVVIVVSGQRGKDSSRRPHPGLSSNLALLELKLLGLEVGCGVEVERAALCGFGDQTWVFVDLNQIQALREIHFRVMTLKQKAEAQNQDTYIISWKVLVNDFKREFVDILVFMLLQVFNLFQSWWKNV